MKRLTVLKITSKITAKITAKIAAKIAILLCVLGVVAMINCSSPQPGNKEKTGETPPYSPTSTKTLVLVKTVAYEKFENFVQVNATVEAVNEAFISPEINGQIKAIYAKEGQRVNKGDLLVTLNADTIDSSIAEVKSSLELAQTIYEKRKGLWDKKIGSEIQYLEAKTNKESLENRLKTLETQLEMTRIKAPINGIVDKIYQKEGELAVPGMQLLQLVNLHDIYINAEVSESYLSTIEKGTPATVHFPSYPNIHIESTVYRTGNVIKQQNRTFLVQLLLNNKDEKLKPNMIAIIKIRDYLQEEALVVPSIVIKNDLKGNYLFLVDKNQGKNIARKTYIETGRSQLGSTEITQGLTPGRQVIINGYNLVKDGMEVEVQDK